MGDGGIGEASLELVHKVGHKYTKEDRGKLRALWQPPQDFHSLISRYARMENTDVDRPEARSLVLPLSADDSFFKEQTQEFVPEDRWEGSGVVDEGHIRGFLFGDIVMLNNGEE